MKTRLIYKGGIDAVSFFLRCNIFGLCFQVKQLRNVASCGDVRFYTFHAWAEEMGISEEEINAAYEPSQVSTGCLSIFRFNQFSA